MKIDDSIKKAAGLPVGQPQVRPEKTADKAVATAAPVASAMLSSQLQAMSTKIASTSAFDSAKVEEIKAAIANGTFTVNPEKVADELLDTVTDLIHARRKG